MKKQKSKFSNILSRLFLRIYYIGLYKSIYSIIVMVKIRRYYYRYNFDKWHIRNNFYYQPYKRLVVTIASGVTFNKAIEIGGGLGEISSRIDNCLLTDRDENVLRASKKLFPSIEKFLFDFRNQNHHQTLLTKFELVNKSILVIAVNVLIQESIAEFLQFINLLRRSNTVYLIVDVERDFNPTRHGVILHQQMFSEFKLMSEVNWPLENRKIALYEAK